tara:strand:+ start:4128 stop:4916 length:789 start_codon:yes stop_codon:yes gene_type:complete
MKPKISIITATYHRPDLLARCIKAVQQSTFKEYEHIIVSDHCPKARQVYELFSDDKRIVFLENPPPHIHNQGARGQNFGIMHARSKYICYCNDDNIIMPNHLELLHDNLSTGECDVVYLKTHEIRIGQGNNMIQKIIARDFFQDLEPEKYVKDDLMYSDPRDMSNLGHTADIVKISGMWKLAHECKDNIEDTDFLDRLDAATQENRIFKVPAYSNVYYVRGSCFVRDNAYHKEVLNLEQDRVFVYPELLVETGVINKNMVRL